jgi:hypothetical protein
LTTQYSVKTLRRSPHLEIVDHYYRGGAIVMREKVFTCRIQMQLFIQVIR